VPEERGEAVRLRGVSEEGREIRPAPGHTCRRKEGEAVRLRGVRVGGKEADETAKTYGTVCAALFPVLTALSKVLRIRRKRVLVQPDFLAEAVTVRMRTVLWIWPFGIVGAAVVGLFRIVMTWIKATKAPVGASESINTKAEIRRDL